MKKSRIVGLAAVAAVWLALSAAAWVSPAKDISEAERRKLAQFPALTAQSVGSGRFMTDFERYTLDQFPLRDAFRRLKAVVHYDLLGQRDNNGIYLTGGSAAELEYPLNEVSVSNALKKFNALYETYLSGSRVVVSVVPDKGYYLAEKNGYPAMDYEALFAAVEDGMDWAEYVDLTDLLSAEDYYRTDTHWRQERLLGVSQRLCQALDAQSFLAEELTQTTVERPFYGVYCGQAALPMKPDTMYTMENSLISACTVFNHETKETTSVYNMDKLESRDLYDVYLSGATPLLTIDNPNAETDRELIVFRDSFGSSLTPLLLKSYKTVTLVDIRYLASDYLGQFVDFHGQDVLFLYSTLVLNNSGTLK